MNNTKNINTDGIDMKHAPLPAKSEMPNEIGGKIAAWGIVLMIIYLFIAK